MSKRMKLAGLGAAGGVLAAIGWLPLGLSALFPVLLVPVMVGLRSVDSGRDAVALGLGFGIARYAVAGHFLLFLLSYSPLAIAFYLLAVLYVVPFGLMEACGAFWLERRARVPRYIGFAALFAVGEFFRTLGDLSFPADLLAHGMGPIPAWLGWAPWLGPYYLSFLALGAGALVAEGWLQRRRSAGRAAALLAVGVAVWALPAITDLATDRARASKASASLRIGIVQHAATVQDKHDPRRHELIWKRLERLSRRAANRADLVIWPEAARPGHLIWNTRERLRDPRVEALAAEIGVPILYGAAVATTDSRQVTALYNGAVLIRPDGSLPQWYGKQRLLPFAERPPFAEMLGWDPSRRRPGGGYLTMLGNFSPGPKPTIFRVGEARLGVLICYEGFYPALARRYRLEGANMLVTLTNDSWWGRSVFPSWHARMASSRAQENDLPVVRAATTGVSSVTDRHGRLQAATELAEVTVLSAAVPPASSPPTAYARLGDAFILVLVLGLGGMLAATQLASYLPHVRRTPKPTPAAKQRKS